LVIVDTLELDAGFVGRARRRRQLLAEVRTRCSEIDGRLASMILFSA